MMKILPFKYPEITAYPFHANIYAILCNYEYTLPWFYNYYIQLELGPWVEKEVRLDFCTAWPTGHFKNCPWLDYGKVSRKFIKKKWTSVIDYIIDSIDDDNYIFCDVDEYYIPYYVRYNKINYQHEIFVYGYDKEDKVLYVADFFETSNKYQFKKVAFQDFQKGYSSVDELNLCDHVDGLISLKFIKDAKYVFDIDLVSDLINDYIASENSNYRYRLIDARLNEGYVYGAAIYDSLIQHIDILAEKEIPVDIRGYHVLWEHKKLISMLIKYIYEHKYLKDGQELYELYKINVEAAALQIRNRMIRYRFKFDRESLRLIKEDLINMKVCELDVFKSLLVKLKEGN